MGENDKYRKCNSKSLQYVIYWITPTQTLNADQNINIITISVFTDDTARPEVKKRFYANSQDPGFIGSVKEPKVSLCPSVCLSVRHKFV